MCLVLVCGLGCDPPSGRSRGDETTRRTGSGSDPARGPLGDARIVLRDDGTLEIYGHQGQLQLQIADPSAQFAETLEPMAGPLKFGAAHGQIRVPISGLSDWLRQRGSTRRAASTLDAEGLTRSHRTIVEITQAAENTERALMQLAVDLPRLWADSELPVERRREMLFERWDDCAETDGAPDMPVVRAEQAATAILHNGGARARAMIIDFTRRELPEGSAGAFPPAQLDRLNARRRSTARFDPYAAELTE